MTLQKLIASAESAAVQETTFSTDALGRYICNTWEEMQVNPDFDAVVLGSGMYGAYCAAKIFRNSGTKRVLVLEAGSFLVSEHIQNLANIGLNVPAPINPVYDTGKPRELVWGIPWRGNTEFPGMAYCIGGKSIYWGGWCPRLTDQDLQKWPMATAQYLRNNYPAIENELGVTPTTDFITGALNDTLKASILGSLPAVANLESVEDAPLAVQGSPPASGLFSFDKYSSGTLLIDAVRRDSSQSGFNDSNRRLVLVPKAHVVKLHAQSGKVTMIEVHVDGIRRFLQLSQHASVVLALSAIESTRVALHSFPSAIMGRNLMAHIRSDFTIRIRKSAFNGLSGAIDTAALLVRGSLPTGKFHLQVTASADTLGSDEMLFRMIPDLDVLRQHLANVDSEWITITLRGVGEMHGSAVLPVPNAQGSWINLSPYEYDEFGVPRAYVNMALSSQDEMTWKGMDNAALNLAQKIAGVSADIQYFYDGNWQNQPFPLDRPFPSWHRGLGTTYHESGTLWMGDDPNTSVTNPMGRFHHIQNCYACDQSVFPSVGSANPVLTGLVLAKQLAEAIAV